MEVEGERERGEGRAHRLSLNPLSPVPPAPSVPVPSPSSRSDGEEGRGSNPRLLTAASSPHSEMSCFCFSSLFSFRLFSLPPPPRQPPNEPLSRIRTVRLLR